VGSSLHIASHRGGRSVVAGLARAELVLANL